MGLSDELPGALLPRALEAQATLAALAEAMSVSAPMLRFTTHGDRALIGLVGGRRSAVCVELPTSYLELRDERSLLGTLAHEVGHLAAGHFDAPVHVNGLRYPRRYVAREHEANICAAQAVGVEPLQRMYAHCITDELRGLYGMSHPALTPTELLTRRPHRWSDIYIEHSLLRRLESLDRAGGCDSLVQWRPNPATGPSRRPLPITSTR